MIFPVLWVIHPTLWVTLPALWVILPVWTCGLPSGRRVHEHPESEKSPQAKHFPQTTFSRLRARSACTLASWLASRVTSSFMQMTSAVHRQHFGLQFESKNCAHFVVEIVAFLPKNDPLISLESFGSLYVISGKQLSYLHSYCRCEQLTASRSFTTRYSASLSHTAELSWYQNLVTMLSAIKKQFCR